MACRRHGRHPLDWAGRFCGTDRPIPFVTARPSISKNRWAYARSPRKSSGVCAIIPSVQGRTAVTRTAVNRILTAIAVCASAAAFAAPALAAADMSLTRLDCGTPQAPIPVNQRFSDTYAYGDLKLQFVYSCYLIKHGDDYLLWDTGHAMTAPNVAPKVSIVDQLAKLNLKPYQIKY